MSSEINYFNVCELFKADKYLIPIYQRNYAWTEKEITQLIQDVVDYCTREGADVNYYIGTLVVYKRKWLNGAEEVFETIDGQQRLTTLSILLGSIKNNYSQLNIEYGQPHLIFASRPKSNNALVSIASDRKPFTEEKDYDTAIRQAYFDVKKILPEILKNSNLTVEKFYTYLLNRVQLLRVSVPEDTDLNHYFEIMNSRGEQLEKHEVLKARLLSIIKKDKKAVFAFNLIWEACANMETYVQYGFSPDQRTALFGNDWNTLSFTDFADLKSKVLPPTEGSESKLANDTSNIPMLELLGDNPSIGNPKNSNEDNPDRFNSVINFSNFLLQVLRIKTGKDIFLDDKNLLNAFEPYLKTEDDKDKLAFVEDFGANLLKCRFLLDKFILKREFSSTKDGWSLKVLKRNESSNVSYVNTFGTDVEEADNKAVLMILAMFHVSAPTQVYKHWLNAALKYVFENPEANAGDYLDYLEKLARIYLSDWFLLDKRSKNFYDIIYTPDGLTCTNQHPQWELLNRGTAVENFIFNYLDYLIWKEEKPNNFEFSFRSSVEHYYPQNPMGQIAKFHEDILNSFGNLCLISNSKNSKLSNYLPEAKKDHYRNNKSIDSLKQQKMMEYENWGEDEIAKHRTEMENILRNALSQQ